MKPKKLSIALFLLFGLGGVYAQQAIPSAGGEATGSNGKISYSIGQLAYATNSSSDGSIAEGIQQAFEIFTTGTDAANIQLELAVYPNPTADFLNLEIVDFEAATLSYQLFNLEGKLLASQKSLDRSTKIKMKNFPSATYFLKISDQQNNIKTFKIIKN